LRRAFNSQVPEQLNAWLTSFEAQSRQRSDTSFDFYIHCILLYKEKYEKQIKRHGKDFLIQTSSRVYRDGGVIFRL
ncbi:hypothetical protein M422DRAFT_190700, partial [Sphaerobolus stellatus SS14]